MTDDSTENHLAIEVYRDVSENIRLYARQRFTLLTIFVAVTGGLLAVAYTKEGVRSRWLLELLGFITAPIFLIMEWRTTNVWRYFKDCACALEHWSCKTIPCKQYTSWPRPTPPFTQTWATRLLILVVLTGWLALLITEAANPAPPDAHTPPAVVPIRA